MSTTALFTAIRRSPLPLLAALSLSYPAVAIGPAPSALAPEEAPVKSQPTPTTTRQTEAAVIPTGAKSATKAELDAIRTQNALDAERMKGLKAAGGMGGTGLGVPAIDARPIAVTGNAGRSGGSPSASSARVTMVAGPQGQLAATILTSNGLIVVRAGDRVPGLGTIRAISVSQVLVEDGKRTVSLPFAAEPASSLIQGGSPMPGNQGMPGSPLLPGGF